MAGYGKEFKAKFGNELCSDCKLSISAGSMVRYKYNGPRALCHANCGAAKDTAKKIEAEAPYNISGGSGYGYSGWTAGQVVRIDKRVKHYADYPDYVTVVRSSKRYFREDGLSFGVGDDQGYIYSAACRAATVEEIAPMIERAHTDALRDEALRQLKTIRDTIRQSENYVTDGSQPDGDRLMDTQNIYGGGDWWVVGPAGIWYIENNGTDGGDWSHNNVRTGGAGAVGWRVPYTVDMATQIVALANRIGG